MKHVLLIATVLVLGCCFGGTLYAQAPCCKPKPDCKMACAPDAASANNGGETSVAAVSATGKACAGHTAQAAPTARPMGVFVADAQNEGATAKAACDPTDCDLSKCDPTNCDWSKCLPPGCDPTKCDISKCLPGKAAASGKASKAVRF